MKLIGVLLLISTIVSAQKILVVENVNSLKNFKYYQGEDIIIKISDYKSKMHDNVSDMTDSTVIFEILGEVGFEHILYVYRENRMIHLLRGLILIGGAAYFGIDSFNRLINNNSPVILTETVIISAGMVASSFALIPLNHRKINTRGNWHLRTIDMNEFGDYPIK